MNEHRLRLTKPQARVFRSRARFRILVAGRRFGKSYLAGPEILGRAVNCPRSISWYIAPTYRMAEQIFWSKLKEFIPPQYIRKKNETDLSVELRNGSIIALRGADNPDSLRGVGLDFVVLDEAAMMGKALWFEIIRPALADKQGEALFISTPAGFNWFYDLVEAAQGKPDWEVFRYTTAQGGNVPLSEIESARADMDPRTFRQEFEASFENLAGRVYYAFDTLQNSIPYLDDSKAPLLVGMDFNVNPMTAVVSIRRGDQLHVLDEILIPNANTELMAQTLKSKYPGRPITVFPDPTGNARKTSAPVGQTDFVILRSHGFTVLAPQQPYAISDKYNTVNAALCNAGGVRRVFLAAGRCPELRKALNGLVYKEGTGVADKSSGLDHVSDALAYLVCWEIPMRGKAGLLTLEAG